MLRYLNDKALPIYDPFCGGGSIPLEVQRLGLRAVGSDLNPDADPMGIALDGGKEEEVPWRGAAGLADDIRYYGRKMRELAWERIGHLYPKAKLPKGGEATVIAWLWARTVPCPNPACGVAMPLLRPFQLSTKANNRQTYFRNSAPVSPVIAANSESKTSPGIRPEGTVSVAMSRIGIPSAIATVPPRAVLLAFLPARATPR